MGRARAFRGPAHVLYCIFDSLRKKKEERSVRPAGSCRCGPEIKFLDLDRPATHVANNGLGQASSGLVPGWVEIGPARVSVRPMPLYPQFDKRDHGDGIVVLEMKEIASINFSECTNKIHISNVNCLR